MWWIDGKRQFETMSVFLSLSPNDGQLSSVAGSEMPRKPVYGRACVQGTGVFPQPSPYSFGDTSAVPASELETRCNMSRDAVPSRSLVHMSMKTAVVPPSR